MVSLPRTLGAHCTRHLFRKLGGVQPADFSGTAGSGAWGGRCESCIDGFPVVGCSTIPVSAWPCW
eukprot:8467455-Pyramimonas_sp.AAC.1